MTKQEAILAALHAFLVAALPDLKIERNPALARMVDDHVVSLRDGRLDLVEEYLNGPIFDFTMTPTIVVALEKGAGGIDAAVNGVIDRLATSLDAAGSLGGLADDIRVGVPETDTLEMIGATDIKGAELPIEIDFWSDRRVG